MANSDASQYTLRYNEISGALEVCIGSTWTPVQLKAASINSGAATVGQLLTADGSGGATWEDPA